MLQGILRAFKRCIGRPETASAPDPPGAAIQRDIERYQRDAWKDAGLAERVNDPDYPFSGHFDPPEPVEREIAYIVMATSVVGRPIIRKEPLTTAYQEKITPPILLNAWNILRTAGQVPDGLIFGQNVFVATTPGGHLYPEVRTDLNGDHAIIYDASLLFTYLVAASLLSRICAVAEAKRASEVPGCWADGFTLARSLPDLLVHQHAITQFAQHLATLVKYGHPFHPLKISIGHGTFVPRIVTDIYTFTLGHEIGHIQLGHTRLAASSENLEQRERAADVYGFALYSNAMKADLGGNFAAYVHVAFCFHIMAYIYRAANLVQQQPDYGFWTLDQMQRLYFPPDSWGFYPHPRARLDLLRREILARGAPPNPNELPDWDRIIDTFFETLWKLIYAELIRHHGAIHPTWSAIAEHHQRALKTA